MRIQRVIFIEKHIRKLRARVKLDTQQLRYNVINKLTDLFNAASGMAKSRGLDVKDRQEWTRIAGYIAQTIESISKGYDEKQIDHDLASLEKMIDEARAKGKTGKTKTEASSTEAATTAPGAR